MLAQPLSLLGRLPPPICGVKRERSSLLDSTVSEQGLLHCIHPSTTEVAELLFSLKSGKSDSTSSTIRQEENESALQLREERSSSSSGSACSTHGKLACKALSTRSYVWRGPKRSLLNPGLANACPVHLLSSDPEEEDDFGGGGGGSALVAGAQGAANGGHSSSAGERSDRDKEWAALTTWLRMNLHHPRTAKREVLFLGKHVEGRGWHFFLNPALAWDDVSPETKMRLRTLPHETELAFMRKYPGKPGRDWVKKSQKYRPPGCAVTYAVPLADMVYSLTAIYYRFEGRPGTGAYAANRAAAAAPTATGATAAAALAMAAAHPPSTGPPAATTATTAAASGSEEDSHVTAGVGQGRPGSGRRVV